MTKREWIEQAIEYERLEAETADETLAEYYHVKAAACRDNAAYGRDED